MTPTLAITRRASPQMAECELTHLERTPIDLARAEAQHAAYRGMLAACGVTLIDLPPLDDHPDCAFVEDVMVALPEVTLLCRPGAASRRGEVEAIMPALPDDRPVERVGAPGTIDGGDVLRIGRELFIGRSSRTNGAGIAAVAAQVRRFGYSVTAVDVPGALHLKTAVTAIADDVLLINPAWVDASAFAGRRCIEVAADEPFGANCLPVGGRLLYAAGHPATAARIEATGVRLEPVDISEFAKAEAGLTCLSVIVPGRA